MISLDKTEAVPLPAFPTLPVIAKAREATTQLTGQSKQMMSLAVEFNKREPLIQGMQEKGPEAYQRLIDAYYRQLSKDVK